MPKQEKGKSHSIRPVSRRAPSWCKYQPEEVESFIIKLAKEGHSLSGIGTILRDQYAIPLVKPLIGKSISDVLEGASLAPTLPEDLANLMKKAQSLALKHGLRFGACREGLEGLNTSICDGSWLLNNTAKQTNFKTVSQSS